MQCLFWLLGCGYQCNVCIQDFVVSVVLVWLLHICMPIYMWGCVHIWGWGKVFLGLHILGQGDHVGAVEHPFLHVSSLVLRYWGLVCTNMYVYSHLLVCCFVVLLVLVCVWPWHGSACIYALLGLLFCWVVVVGLLFWLWHAGVGIYMHSFVYCLWFLVFLCRSDICFIYIYIYIYAMFVLVAWLWVPV